MITLVQSLAMHVSVNNDIVNNLFYSVFVNKPKLTSNAMHAGY